jgi:hypothetical protein
MDGLLVEGVLPLKLEEFNAFHHGDMVVKQDLAVLEDLLREGEREGRKMKDLREICRRIEEVEKEKAKAKARTE